MKNIKIGNKLINLDNYGIITLLGKSGTYRTSIALQMADQIVDGEKDIIYHYDLCQGMTKYHSKSCLSKENFEKYFLIQTNITIDDLKDRINTIYCIKKNNHDNVKVVIIIDTVELFSGCSNTKDIVKIFSDFISEYHDKIKNNNIYIIAISTLVTKISSNTTIDDKLNYIVDGLNDFNLYEGLYTKSNPVIKMINVGYNRKLRLYSIKASILKYDNICSLVSEYGSNVEYMIGDSTLLLKNSGNIKINNRGRLYARNKRTRVKKYFELNK